MKPNFFFVDHSAKNISAPEGVVVLESPKAYEEFSWTRSHFQKKPSEGYFVWIQRQVDFSLSSCIAIASSHLSQELSNLVVVEDGVRAEMRAICQANEEDLCGKHTGSSRIILKKESSLNLEHFHRWGKEDSTIAKIECFLEQGAKLNCSYRSFQLPKKLDLKTRIHIGAAASADLKTTLKAEESDVMLGGFLDLDDFGASGRSTLRLAAGEGAKIEAHSAISARAEGRGHLDCSGLLLADDASIKLIPELLNENKKALITHEASVGRIAEEELLYLESRGLTEDQAIGLIVGGFLEGGHL